MALAKFGSPEWKSVAETRHAKLVKLSVEDDNDGRSFVVLKWGYRCGGCYYPMHMGDEARWCSSLQEALKCLALHDLSHEKRLAACCMYAIGAVCECGNVLV